MPRTRTTRTTEDVEKDIEKVKRLLQEGKISKKDISGPGSIGKKALVELASKLGWKKEKNGMTKREQLEKFVLNKQEIEVSNVEQRRSLEIVKPWTIEELKNRLDKYQSFEDIEKEKKNKKLGHHGIRFLANNLFLPEVFSKLGRSGKIDELLDFIKTKFQSRSTSIPPTPTTTTTTIVQQAPIVSQVPKVPQEPIISQVPEEPIVSQVPQEPIDSQVHEEPIVSQVPEEPKISQVSQEPQEERRRKRERSIFPKDSSAEEISTFPVDLSTIVGFGTKDLSRLLGKYGMKTDLVSNKDTLLNLFKNKKCDKSVMTKLVCTEEEVCDLRNKLCLPDIRPMDRKKFMVFLYKGYKILGEKEMEKELKHLLPSFPHSSPESTSPPVHQVQPRRDRENVEKKIPTAFHPPRYSKYFSQSKKDEEELRKTVLKCFQLVSS
jgi:hypothetical protein